MMEAVGVDKPLSALYDCFLFDLDGTIWEGGCAIKHAVDSVNECPSACYVTNNASRSGEMVAQKLREIGIDARATDVVTSADVAVTLALEHVDEGARVLVLGSASFKQLAKNAGFCLVDSADDGPEAILQGHCEDTGWRELSEAALAIRKGAVYIASNLDTSLPSERGLKVGNGSMVAAVTSATGVKPLSAGKPQPAAFHVAAGRLNSKKPLAVGDRLDTDIAGGIAAGMDTLHVLTGVSGPWDIVHTSPEYRAHYVAMDLQALHAPARESDIRPRGGFRVTLLNETEQGWKVALEAGDEDAHALDALTTVMSAGVVVSDIECRSEIARRAVNEW